MSDHPDYRIRNSQRQTLAAVWGPAEQIRNSIHHYASVYLDEEGPLTLEHRLDGRGLWQKLGIIETWDDISELLA